MGGRRGGAPGRHGLLAALVPAVLALTACAAPAPPVAAPSPGQRVASASAPAGDRGLAAFAAIAEQVVRTTEAPGGMDFVHALERAGYDRSRLQVTADRTSVGLAVPAVQFAARAGGSCLIGQYGGGRLHVLRAAPVDGACLIGETRRLG